MSLANLVCLEDYTNFVQKLAQLPDEEEKTEICRYVSRRDLFFFLWFVLKRNDVFNPWLLERCKDVQNEPNGHLDIWAREHYKSTIITYAKTLQDVMASHGDDALPEWNGINPSFGLFSFNRSIAKAFLSQIKRECEQNKLLISLFPDVVWSNPEREAPKWSLDDGIIFKRKSNQKESTIEAWGLIDSMPTSKHFNVMVYDDLVTRESVSSPLMQAKVLDSYELSISLGAEGGYERMIGTRYGFSDLYGHLIKKGIFKLRHHACTTNGEADGEPVLMTQDSLRKKRIGMGIYNFSCQMLGNPVKDSQKGFRREWLRFHTFNDYSGLNIYIIVDPANSKKKTSDYTAMVVVGLGADTNYYVIDIYRSRLSLTERANLLFMLHRKYRPIAVGYERYGMQADVDYCKDKMNRDKYSFDIIELHDGLNKVDRIEGLVPLFENHRLYLPQTCFKIVDDKEVDITKQVLDEEYDLFPVAQHDDVLDALARINDAELDARFPIDDYINVDELKDGATSFWGR